MSFDRLAPIYRTLELTLAGGKLQRCRMAWVEVVRPARNLLLVGEGHGRFLEACAAGFSPSRITCVDASAAMLRIAGRRWRAAGGDPGRVEFIHAELPAWTPPEARYDLVVTNFFFDCFPPDVLEEVVVKLAAAATPAAQWLVSDFAVPERGWRRWRAQMILGLAYTFFRSVAGLKSSRITPPDPLLQQSGFRLAGRRTCEWGLLYSDLWER